MMRLRRMSVRALYLRRSIGSEIEIGSGLLFISFKKLFFFFLFLRFTRFSAPSMFGVRPPEISTSAPLSIERARVHQLVSHNIIYGYDDDDNVSCFFPIVVVAVVVEVGVCVCRVCMLFFALLSNHLSFFCRLFFFCLCCCCLAFLPVLILLSCRSLCFTAHFTDDKIAYFTKALQQEKGLKFFILFAWWHMTTANARRPYE